jgi:hypothetical protein
VKTPFPCESPPPRSSRPAIRRSALAAFLITLGWLATARADLDDLPPAGDPREAAGIPRKDWVQSNASVNPSASSGAPDVSVTVPPPSGQEWPEASLYQFIVHHATVLHVDDPTARDLVRWRGGKQSICPLTVGLSPQDDALVTARVRALAAYVGAPVQSDSQCKGNVQIIFTNNPQEKMDHVLKWAAYYFRNRYAGGMRDLIAFNSGHAVQGWYMTTRGGPAVLNTDVSLVGLDLLPLWPKVTQNYAETRRVSTRGGGAGSSESGIGLVILVVDTTQVASYAITTVADYLAMLTLSVVQSPDHCDALPSILDLMSSTCGARPAPTGMTTGDIAFLKAFYNHNTGLGGSLSRADIQGNMLQQFRHP